MANIGILFETTKGLGGNMCFLPRNGLCSWLNMVFVLTAEVPSSLYSHLANKVRYTVYYSRLVPNGVALTTFLIGYSCMRLLDKYAFALLRDIDAAGGREDAAALEVVEFLTC